MKIKRFFSNDMRNAIRLVREELGSDAVILSNSRVNGGVEVVAAIDYDESIFKGASSEVDTQQASTTASEEYPAYQTSDRAHGDSRDTKLQTTNTQAANAHAAIAHTTRADNSTAINDRAASQLQATLPSMSNAVEDLSQEQKQNSDFSYFLKDDEAEINTSAVEASLYDTVSTSHFPPATPAKTETRKDDASVWSQEPTLVEMRKDINGLKDLLEKQLTGLAWGDFARNNPMRAKLLRQLLELGLSAKLAGKIADSIGDNQDSDKCWQHALRVLAAELPTINDDLIADGGVVALIGPTGVGKTTTVAKLAARYALRNGRNKVALVTTDSFRIGAHEQLKTYGRILGMPVRVASNQEELVDILRGFADKDLVLIDTAGMSHRDIRLMEQFNMISESAPSIKNLLVMSATTHSAGLDEAVRVFQNVDLAGCVITKLDETTSLTGCLSVAIEHQLPIAYVSDGQKVPEDLHLARAHSLVNQSVLISRKANQTLENESLELAFSRVTSNAYV